MAEDGNGATVDDTGDRSAQGLHQVGEAAAGQQHDLWVLLASVGVGLHEGDELADKSIWVELPSKVVLVGDKQQIGQLLQGDELHRRVVLAT